MEMTGVFIAAYLVIGISSTVAGILLKNRPEKAATSLGRKAA